MKNIFSLTLFFVSFLTSFEALAKEARDMSEPPFIMSSYDEFTDLQKEQKDLYLKELALSFKDVPSLKANDTAKLDEASEWYASWDLIRKSVYDYCDENAAAKVCEKLADLRVKTLNNYALKPFDLDK
jgi:hypothetical protein